jgi:hypothetical protein
VNVSIKNVDPVVMARLAEQAKAEGMSQQEWLRQILARTAGRLSPAEVVARSPLFKAMTDAEFSEFTAKIAARRTRARTDLGA